MAPDISAAMPFLSLTLISALCWISNFTTSDANITDENGVTALMLAAMKRGTDVVELFIQHSADVNVIDEHGMTALVFAVITRCGRITDRTRP